MVEISLTNHGLETSQEGSQDTCLLPGQPQLLHLQATMETTIHLTGPSRGMVRIFIDRLGRAGGDPLSHLPHLQHPLWPCPLPVLSTSALPIFCLS